MFRMAGYGNIFGLKFGMASWNKNYADIWTKNISDKYSSKIETKVNNKIKKSTSFPEIKTGKISTYEILKARIEKEIISEFLINADDIFQNSEKYYIINYWPEDIYLKGHIPGAVNYIPKTSLGIDQNLSSLPTNKPIVIYCFSGNTASFVAAYLRVLGYDAYALSYGVNGFMRNSMKSIGIENHIFDPNSEVNNFPLTVGDKPSIESETNLEIKQTNTNSSNEVKSNNSKPVKKKEKKQGGGC